MASREWTLAQREEFRWWTKIQERLKDAQSVEQKRQSTLAIWRYLQDLGVPTHAKVLEIGTGGDGFVNFVPASFRVGLEPLLNKMRREGIGIFSPSAHFVSGVGERLPFREDAFDVVFLYNVLDHMAHPSMAMDEIARVLRRGGWLHLLVDTYSLRFKLYRRFVRHDMMHPHTFTASEIRRWLRRRGLHIIHDVSDMVPMGRRKGRAVRVFCVMTG